MPATKKINMDERKREADAAGKEQVSDIFSMISGLGSSSDDDEPAPRRVVTEQAAVERKPVAKVKPQIEPEEVQAEIPVVTKIKTKKAETKKENKPGYVSLVISNNLKTKWKTYSSAHGMSLTDCMKLAMKLLEDMEQKEAISIEDGFLTYLE